jgi:hypothetical protein
VTHHPNGNKRKNFILNEDMKMQTNVYTTTTSPTSRHTMICFGVGYRMQRPLFFRIVQGVQNHDPYFQIKVDGTGRQGLSTLQKCMAVIRTLAYGVAADAVDEYLNIGESTTTECLQKNVQPVINIFGEEYMRRSDAIDIQRLLQMGQKGDF